MNTATIMQRWTKSVQTRLPETHHYQANALAAFSFAAARARHCHLSRLAHLVPTQAMPVSTLRRLKRFLGNDRLKVQAICSQMASWLRRWNAPTARLHLLLDETPSANRWRVLKMSVSFRRRALPLCWRTDELANRSLIDRVDEVLEETAQLVSRYCPQAQVVLLADRGLCWPQIIRFCLRHGWHFVLRAQSQTRFRWRDKKGALHCGSLRSHLDKPGDAWCGRGQAFAKAGWIDVAFVGCWRKGAKEPWLLVTDKPPSLFLLRWYARRMWHEQSFRDEKSHGFCWQVSRVLTGDRMHRLLLVLALAQLWLMFLGTIAVNQSWAGALGFASRTERRRWSVFARGYQLLIWCIDHARMPPRHLGFAPP